MIAVKAPDYELFSTQWNRHGHQSVWRSFLETLVEGVPCRLPDHLQGGRGTAGMNSSSRHAAKQLGLNGRLAFRTFGGEVWVCLLREEDARK